MRIKMDLRNCDCMDLMKEFPDKHFQLAIVDPPYGIGEDGGDKKRNRGYNKIVNSIKLSQLIQMIKQPIQIKIEES